MKMNRNLQTDSFNITSKSPHGGKYWNFVCSWIGLLSFIYLLLACIFQRRFIMVSIMSMEELTNFYKARVKTAAKLIIRPLLFSLSTSKPITELTVSLQPAIDCTTLLFIMMTCCMIVFCIWKQAYMSLWNGEAFFQYAEEQDVKNAKQKLVFCWTYQL